MTYKEAIAKIKKMIGAKISNKKKVRFGCDLHAGKKKQVQGHMSKHKKRG